MCFYSLFVSTSVAHRPAHVKDDRREAVSVHSSDVCAEFTDAADILWRALGRGVLHCSDPGPWTQRQAILLSFWHIDHANKTLNSIRFLFSSFSSSTKGEPGEKGQKGAPGRPGRVGPPGEIGIILLHLQLQIFLFLSVSKTDASSSSFSKLKKKKKKESGLEITLLGLIMCCYITARPSRDGQVFTFG